MPRLVLKAKQIDAEAVAAEQRLAGVLQHGFAYDKRCGGGWFRFGRHLWNVQGRAEDGR
jgi:hypothetical protein